METKFTPDRPAALEESWESLKTRTNLEDVIIFTNNPKHTKFSLKPTSTCENPIGILDVPGQVIIHVYPIMELAAAFLRGIFVSHDESVLSHHTVTKKDGSVIALAVIEDQPKGISFEDYRSIMTPLVIRQTVKYLRPFLEAEMGLKREYAQPKKKFFFWPRLFSRHNSEDIR